MRRYKKRRSRNKGFRILLLVVVMFCIAIIFKQEYQIYEIQKEKEATAARIEKLTEIKNKLEQEKQDVFDVEYIEKLARDEYNMVKQGEIPVFIVEEQKETSETQKEKSR